MSVVLAGVDGGNSKTIALVARPDGTIVGTGRVDRNGDPHKVGIERAVGVHREALESALAAAGASPHDVLAAALSLAGADWPEDIEALAAAHRAWLPSSRVVNDAIGALRTAVPSGPGVVVVCGTGTATGARGPDGRTWHSSFWQEPQGGHELGVRALQAVYRADLGIDPPTALTSAILEATGEPSVEALLHHATARGMSDRRDPAVLAPVLLDTAAAADPAALAIVTAHGASLGRTAVAAARRVGIPLEHPFPLALTGGVMGHPSPLLPDAIAAAVRAAAPRVVVTRPDLEPAVGALLLAFDAAERPAGADVVDRIRATGRASGQSGSAA
jgi:N-acetylglucosamine kinase-like BadF-type ATPase